MYIFIHGSRSCVDHGPRNNIDCIEIIIKLLKCYVYLETFVYLLREILIFNRVNSILVRYSLTCLFFYLCYYTIGFKFFKKL